MTEVLGEMIISLLKHSRQGPISRELVKNDARLPSRIAEALLQQLQQDGLLYLEEGSVRINTLQRLELAVYALRHGADHERVSGLLDWREFERIAGVAFEAHDYAVKTNVRFKQGGRRWELDVVACKKPLVVCADCKHWTRNLHPSKLKRAVEEQAGRTLAFSGSWPNPAVKIDCVSWNDLRFVPMILSLTPTSLRFYDGTPIVAILQLRDFLAQLPMYVDSMKHFDRKHEQFKIVS